jgi:hypothetical protein
MLGCFRGSRVRFCQLADLAQASWLRLPPGSRSYFASSAIVYDRLVAIESARNQRVHTTNVLETLVSVDAMVDQKPVRLFDHGDERFLSLIIGAAPPTPRRSRNQASRPDNPRQQARVDE